MKYKQISITSYPTHLSLLLLILHPKLHPKGIGLFKYVHETQTTKDCYFSHHILVKCLKYLKS